MDHAAAVCGVEAGEHVARDRQRVGHRDVLADQMAERLAVEQLHDDAGISWPAALAPYDVHVVALAGVAQQAEEAADVLAAAGADVLLDDRELRAGEKFADADLIGIPVRVTVGKKTLDDGRVDVKRRSSGGEVRVEVAQLGKEVPNGQKA